MKLSKARAKNNLSQAGLAQLIGMTQGQISNIEMGKSYPHAANRYKIEMALGCEIDWIATKLSGGAQNLTAIPENESPEDRVIREMGIFIESADKAEKIKRYEFIINYVGRKKRKDVLMEKLKKLDDKSTFTPWEKSVIDELLQLEV